MDAIDTLMNEHRTIERVIDALVAFAGDARRRRVTAREELSLFVGFLQQFADGIHHGKEEHVLFQALLDHGFPREGGPVAMMLLEHARGRALVEVLDRAAAPSATPWDDDDRRTVEEAARAYAALLHAHIHKEDAILYPMAEQHLPAEVMDAVSLRCQRVDETPEAQDLHARFSELAASLVARHLSPVHAQEIRS